MPLISLPEWNQVSDYFFPKSAVDLKKLESERIDVKIKNFEKAWNDLKTADFMAVPSTSVAFYLLCGWGLLGFVATGVFGFVAYRYLQRSEKLDEFKVRLLDLYHTYKERVDQRLMLDEETVKMLEALAPFVKNPDVLLPKSFKGIIVKELESGELIIKEEHKKLFEQWNTLLSQFPHNLRINYCDMNGGETKRFGESKMPTFKERVDSTVIQVGYAQEFDASYKASRKRR